MKPTRPIVRYHGGKWQLAKWVISHFPKHRIYVEPFGGGGSVLLQKSRSYCEVYNDIDSDIVNLFRVARDFGDELMRRIELTPYAREELVMSFQPTDDDIERARRTIVRSFMGFSSASASKPTSAKDVGFKSKPGYSGEYGAPTTGFRSNSNRSGTTPALDWYSYPGAMSRILDRLKGVVIENKDATHVMRQHDTINTLHYLDPPYVLSTRHKKEKTREYAHEMSDDQHVDMIEVASQMKGVVIISGCRNEIYDELLGVWHRVDRIAHASSSKDSKRTESLWINRPETISQKQLNLIV